MFEKVNPMHPDKIADRIAGAIVDIAYTRARNPRVAVEVLIGHRMCHIIAESSVAIPIDEIENTVHRIAGNKINADAYVVAQDEHLAENQKGKIRCGDNGIFKGTPTTTEQIELSNIARSIYNQYGSDGKYILDGEKLIICQSNANGEKLKEDYTNFDNTYYDVIANPLGDWTGGTDVDTGATNRKLGSDMGDSVTGGGLHGKDLSKADVSLNIYATLVANQKNKPVEFCCAIGDETVNGIPFESIVEIARNYIKSVGGFEKFAEWGLI